MPASKRDPYQVLGVQRGVSDEEIRAAYRHLVQLHHPDHNGGSLESARRFEDVQEAYAEVRRLRGAGGATAPPPPREQARAPDPEADVRLADLERQVREAHRKREQARQAAREAAARAAERPGRPSDEELGYIKTDDSLGKILADARDELAERLGSMGERPVAQRVSDLIDELEGLVRANPKDPRKR